MKYFINYVFFKIEILFAKEDFFTKKLNVLYI